VDTTYLVLKLKGGTWATRIAEYLSKRQQLTIGLGSLGLVLSVMVWAYSECAKSPSLLAGLVSVILCPPELLSIPLIDVEVGTPDYRIMWAVLVFMNSALYAVIGSVIGKFRWKADE
jgi:hypothetical protein